MPFLLVALVVVVVGVVVLVFRNREPRSMESGIDAYERQREALRPPERDSLDDNVLDEDDLDEDDLDEMRDR
ncbi:MAG: hypothetical protein M5U31_02035 [Acidimicrobiia bacterium]|nr:hypothetical protein [Acidimicrobiia bacterium]